MNYIFARFRLLPALCLFAVVIIISGCAHYGDGYGYHGSRYWPNSSYSSYGHYVGHGRSHYAGHGRSHYGGHHGYYH